MKLAAAARMVVRWKVVPYRRLLGLLRLRRRGLRSRDAPLQPKIPTWGGTQANTPATTPAATDSRACGRFDLLPSGLLPSAPASHRICLTSEARLAGWARVLYRAIPPVGNYTLPRRSSLNRVFLLR